MRKTVKKRLLGFPGFESLCRLLTRNHVRSIMYHRFSPGYVSDARFVDPRALTLQMEYLRDHFTVIHPDQHLEALGGRVPGCCPVVLTADDGYADFYDVAYPVFRRFGFPTMLFVATGFVSGKTWFWWDKLAYLLNEAQGKETLVDLGTKTISLDLTSYKGRTSAWHQVADRFRFMKNDKKESLLHLMSDRLGIPLPAAPPAHYAPVTWDQVREMGRNGIAFGAHTVHHPILSRVSREQAQVEISQSKIQLEKEIDTSVNWFAYPQGGPADFTREIKEMVHREFDGCYLAYQDMDNRGDTAMLPRYCVTDDMISFRWVLCGAEFLGLKVREIFGMQTGTGNSYWAGSEEQEASHE